ncbi:MAG: hypothetical protein ACK5MQ_06975 [Pikeienuella sp.]
MIRRLARSRRPHPALLAAILAILFSLRVFGASAMAAPIAGYTPICTGDGIIYLPVDGNGAVLTGEEGQSAPCPWNGLVAAMAPAPFVAPAPSQTVAAAIRAPEAPAPVLARPYRKSPRAPPMI